MKKVRMMRSFCPGCNVDQDINVDACLKCGFSISRADEWFRFNVPPVTDLIDMSGALGDRDRACILKERNKLMRLFPDVFLSLMVLAAPGHRTLLEFGCWYHNQAQPPEGYGNMENGLIVIVDSSLERAAISMGYSLEPFLDPVDMEKLIKACVTKAQDGDLGKALVSLVKNLRKELLTSWKSYR